MQMAGEKIEIPAVEDGCQLPLDDVIIYLRKLDSIDD